MAWRASSRLFLIGAALWFLGTAGVSRADAVPSSETATRSAEVTREELQMLERAIGGQEAQTKSRPNLWSQPAAVSPSSGQAGVFQTMNPAIAIIMDAAGAYFSQEPLQLGAHDPNKTGFTLQQVEMSISSNIDPFFRLDSNIVFSLFGVEVEEAYATTLALPERLQLRAGQFLTRFGRVNPMHPHSWHFTDQPLVIGKFFGAEGSRGLGAEASWLAPLPWVVEIVGSVNNADGACCARSFFGATNPGVVDARDLLYTLALKQFVPFDADWSLSLGLSGQLGPNATGNNNRTEIYGADFYLRYRPVGSPNRAALSLQGESLFRARQVPARTLQDSGHYFQLVWNINFQWETAARFETVAGLESDPLDPEWIAARRRTSLQVTYYPSHFSRIRLQGSYDDPTLY